MGFFSDLKKKKAAADEVLPSKRSNSVALPATPPPEAARPVPTFWTQQKAHTSTVHVSRSLSLTAVSGAHLPAAVGWAARSAGLGGPPEEEWEPPAYTSAEQFTKRRVLYKSSIATVSLATCAASRQDVIIKQYTKKDMTPSQVHKMLREIRVMHMVKGEAGVAHILGDFEDERHQYIVMEHCAGGDLYHRHIVRGGSDERWACCAVIAPLLAVLARLHRHHRVVHRDIKLENIFLTGGGALRLGDFGLSLVLGEELPFARAGTLDYMAPEVLANGFLRTAKPPLGEGPEVNEATLAARGAKPYCEKVDIWAVGVLAYELVMLEPPFYSKDDKECESRIMMGPALVYFPRRMKGTPWADFVLAALTVDPAQRPSAEQLLAHPWLMQAGALAPPTLQPPAVPAAPAAGGGGERRSSGDFTIAALSLGGGEGAPAAAPLPEAADQPGGGQQEAVGRAEPLAELQEEGPSSGGMTKATSEPSLEGLGAQQAEEASPPPSPSPARQQFQRKASRLGPSTAGPAPPAILPSGGREGAQGGSAAELTRVKAYMTRQGGPLMGRFRVTPASPRGSSAGVGPAPDPLRPSLSAAT